MTLDRGGRLRSFTVLADLAHQATRLTVGGWDVAGKQAIAAEADMAVVAAAELDGGTSGGDILQQALGERRASLAHTVLTNADEARTQAEAQLRTLARRFVVGRGIAETDVALKVGVPPCASTDSAACFPGNTCSAKYVTASTKRMGCERKPPLNAPDWRPSMNPLGDLFDARLPAGLGGRWYGVFPALVIIKDPDGQGRVKISSPWSPDADGAAW